jgi:hypothetical protein
MDRNLFSGLRHHRVEASAGRPLAGLGLLHGRLLPHPRHRDQLKGQRFLR